MDAEQKTIPWEELHRKRLLEDSRLPPGKDDRGKRVSERCLKAILEAIDSFGPTCWTSAAEIGARKGYGERQTRSAIQALVLLDLLDTIDVKRTRSMQFPVVEKRIIWQNLVRHCSDKLQTRFGQVTIEAPAWRKATQAALVPTQAALVPTQAARSADRTSKEQEKERSDGEEDGARDSCISEEAIFEILRLANEFQQRCKLFETRNDRMDNRELILKIAVLWHNGRLSENDVHQVIESFELHRANGEQKGFGWVWECFRRRCNFDRLLATTDFPRSLLEPSPGSGTIDDQARKAGG